MKVKDLKAILEERGVKCTGCTEKQHFVNKVRETEDVSAVFKPAQPTDELEGMSETSRKSLGRVFVHYCLS